MAADRTRNSFLPALEKVDSGYAVQECDASKASLLLHGRAQKKEAILAGRSDKHFRSKPDRSPDFFMIDRSFTRSGGGTPEAPETKVYNAVYLCYFFNDQWYQFPSIRYIETLDKQEIIIWP